MNAEPGGTPSAVGRCPDCGGPLSGTTAVCGKCQVERGRMGLGARRRNGPALFFVVVTVVVGVLLISSLSTHSPTNEDPQPPQTTPKVGLVSLPPGSPTEVARRAINENGRVCGALTSATALNDGTIRAVCSNGQSYRVFAVEKDAQVVLLAMDCEAARRLGVSGC